jgi:vacuolar protein sorting-associated protein 13A/C
MEGGRQAEVSKAILGRKDVPYVVAAPLLIQDLASWAEQGIQGLQVCCVALRCAVLCCAVLCCAVLCCAVLCCAVLCCAVLAVLCCAVLCCAVLCCAGCAVLCCGGVAPSHVRARQLSMRAAAASCVWCPHCRLQVEVSGKLAAQLSEDTLGMVTRAVPVAVSLVPAARASATAQQGLVVQPGQDIQWNERFVLALPPELAEQLLTPAPGDNPFAGVALELKVKVCDGSGERGMGRVLSSSSLPITFGWLLAQTQALLGVRADTAAAAGAATASAGASKQHTPPKPPRAPQQPMQQQAAAAAGGGAAVAQGSPAVAGDRAPAAAGEAAGQRAAGEAAGGCGLGRTQVVRFEAPQDAAAGEGEGSCLLQLTVALSLDDSQVASSWYPHQLMRSRMQQLQQAARAAPALDRSLSAQSVSLAHPPSGQLRAPSRTSLAAAVPPALSAAAAAASQRNALRLEGSDVWSPFSYTSLRRVTGAAHGAGHTGAVPIRAGQGLVLEMSYTGVCHGP